MRSLWFDLRRRDVGVRHRVREKKITLVKKKITTSRSVKTRNRFWRFKKNKIISEAHDHVFKK